MLSEHTHHSYHKDVRQLKTRAATLFLYRPGSLPESLPLTRRVLRELLGMHCILLPKPEQHPMDNSACPPACKTVNSQPSYSVPHLAPPPLLLRSPGSTTRRFGKARLATSKVSPSLLEKATWEQDWSTNVNVECVCQCSGPSSGLGHKLGMVYGNS